MIYFIKAMGIKQVQRRFTRMGDAVIDATPLMTSLGATMMGIIAKIFESQGRRGGGSWKRDTPEWLTRKVRDGLDPRINFASGDLFKSLTEPDAPGQILHITPQSVELGSSLPYAAVTNRNRPFTKFTAGDRRLMADEVRAYLLSAWRTGKAPV